MKSKGTLFEKNAQRGCGQGVEIQKCELDPTNCGCEYFVTTSEYFVPKENNEHIVTKSEYFVTKRYFSPFFFLSYTISALGTKYSLLVTKYSLLVTMCSLQIFGNNVLTLGNKVLTRGNKVLAATIS